MKDNDLLHPPASLFQDRIRAFQETLAEKGLDGAVLLHNPNMFYFAGTVQDAFLWIPREGEAALRVRKHIEKARHDSPITDIQSYKSLKQLPELMKPLLAQAGPRPRIGMEFEVVPVADWRMWRQMIPDAEIDDVSRDISAQRRVKSSHEIASIRAAGEIVVNTICEAAEHYTPGMTELELSACLVHRMRNRGHHGYIRTRGWRSEIYVGGTVSAGTSSSVPWPFDGPVAIMSRYPGINTLNSTNIIRENDPVLIDMLGGFNGYHYDFSRTFVHGRLSDELMRAHALAVKIRDSVVAAMRPGAIPEELYELALNLAREADLAHAFMNHDRNQVKFVGHGIGLELDEGPVVARKFKQPLVEGNVIALEPKFVLPGVGGVGLEDTIAVTRDGAEILVPCPTDVYKLI